jgi:hypothetical protein
MKLGDTIQFCLDAEFNGSTFIAFGTVEAIGEPYKNSYIVTLIHDFQYGRLWNKAEEFVVYPEEIL